MGEAVKAEIAALAEAKETLATTAEGFEVAVNAKRADIAKEAEALHSEMSSVDKAKNGIKSEGPVVGAAEVFPNGKYVNNPKHHINAPEGIGKPPINGQKALDESLAVSNQKYRVCIQDKKFVILREHVPGEWHGYMIENYKDLLAHERNAFYETGLIRSVKSGKIKQ